MSKATRVRTESQEVVPVELFFDLVFVFAVSQLSHHLLSRLTWRGAAETAVLLCAVFGVWAYTSFQATVLGPAQKTSRRALLVVIFFGLVMNAGISQAFADGAWTFVAPLLAIQFGYSALTMRTAAVGGMREHFGRVLAWFCATTPLWIIGASVGGGARLAVWAAAAIVDVTGTWLAHPLPGRVLHSAELPFDAAHMVERLRLFLIIALGEAVLTTGTALAADPTHLPTIVAGFGGLGAVVALWADYFGGANPRVTSHLDETTDPVRSARLGINAMYVAFAGLIALAVGNQLVIAQPGRPGSWPLGLLLFGGPLLYFSAQNWYLARTTYVTSRWDAVTYGALIAGGLAARALPGWASLVVLLAILAATLARVFRARYGVARRPTKSRAQNVSL